MITKTKHLLKIGELAAQSRVSAQAIRYYEELGLLQSSDRTVGAYLTATTVTGVVPTKPMGEILQPQIQISQVEAH
jgi:hypothetical protein